MDTGTEIDHVFFTGSGKGAEFVTRMTARHLTPAVMELGGHSPVVVGVIADVSLAAKRIAWIKWIDGGSNSADAMTKNKPCQALKELIDTHTVNLKVTEWVERVGDHDMVRILIAASVSGMVSGVQIGLNASAIGNIPQHFHQCS